MSRLDVNTVRHTSGSADNITLDASQNVTIEGNLTVDGTATLTGTVTGDSDTIPFRNVVINGAMQVAERGTSETGITTGSSASNSYKKWADRFCLYVQNGGTWTCTQESDGPTGFNKSIKAENTTADASLATSDHVVIKYIVEGQDLLRFKKGTADATKFALSFWVKSDEINKTMVVSLFDSDNTRQIGQSYTTHGTTNTWKKIELVFNGETSNAFTYDNNGSLEIFFFLAAGPDWTSGTLDSSWASYSGGNRAAGQYNLAQATGNYLQITGVQLEAADTCSGFEHKSYGDELAKCQRYFYGHIMYANGPVMSGCNFSNSDLIGTVHFPVSMRASPSIYSNVNDNTDYLIARWGNASGGTNGTGNMNQQRISKNACSLYCPGFSAGTDGKAFTMELNSASAYLGWQSEL